MNRLKFFYLLSLILQIGLSSTFIFTKQVTVLAPFAIQGNEAYFMVQVDETKEEPTISFYSYEEKEKEQRKILENATTKAKELFKSDINLMHYLSETIKDKGFFFSIDDKYNIFPIKFDTLPDLMNFVIANPPFKLFSLTDITNPQKIKPIGHLVTQVTLEITKLPVFKDFLAKQIAPSTHLSLYKNLRSLNTELMNLLANIKALHVIKR